MNARNIRFAFYKTHTEGFYIGLCLLAVIVFKSWYNGIAGDGFGYYNYLPQLFIYKNFDDFTWFKSVYAQYYKDAIFADPLQHFIVNVNHTPVNKYAPGLALLWLPFFWTAHAMAWACHVPTDGYAWPYQMAIGMASVLALGICLTYTLKLLRLWSVNSYPLRILGLLVMCFGTGLFQQALWYSSLSHVYAAAAFTAMVYYLEAYQRQNKTQALGFAAMAFALLISIRPLLLLAVIIWIPYVFKRHVIKWRLKPILVFSIIGCCVILIWTAFWNLKQYGSFWKYTYTQEYFTWLKPQWFHLFFNYSTGLVWNRPWILFGICALLFLKSKSFKYFALFYAVIAYVYSCWWYWPVLSRVFIDVSCIPVLGIIYVIHKYFLLKPKLEVAAALILLLLCGWNSLKQYQQNNNILDAFSCEKDVFWRNAFRIKPACVFSVPKNSIQNYARYTVKDFGTAITSEMDFEMKPKNGFYESPKLQIPKFILLARFKKIRFSFIAQCSMIPSQLHVWMRYFNSSNALIAEIPFYLKHNQLYNDAELYQFGYSESPGDALLQKASKINFAFWMPDDDGKIKVSKTAFEFYSTTDLFETVIIP
jgi:hypothetical protein